MQPVSRASDSPMSLSPFHVAINTMQTACSRWWKPPCKIYPPSLRDVADKRYLPSSSTSTCLAIYESPSLNVKRNMTRPSGSTAPTLDAVVFSVQETSAFLSASSHVRILCVAHGHVRGAKHASTVLHLDTSVHTTPDTVPLFSSLVAWAGCDAQHAKCSSNATGAARI